MSDHVYDPNDELGAHPSDYTNLSDDADGVICCLRCLTAAVLRVARALERRDAEGA